MKKLLGISIVAVLAVVPMMAQATPVAVTAAAAGDEPYQGVALDQDAHIATTSYVQGAYNAAIGAVNDLAGKKQDNLTSGSASGSAISSVVKTTVGAATGENAASDTALVTEKAVRTAIAGAITDAGGQTAQQVQTAISTALANNGDAYQTENAVNTAVAGAANTATFDSTETYDQGTIGEAVKNLATNTAGYQTASDVTTAINSAASGTTDGLDASNGKLSVKYDNSTIDLNASGQLEVKEITASNVATAAKAVGVANNAVNDKLTTQGYVTEAIASAISTAVGSGDDELQTKSDVDTAISTALSDGNYVTTTTAQTATFTPTATGLTSTSIGDAINEVATDAATALGNKRVQVYTTWNSTATNTIQEVSLVDHQS